MTAVADSTSAARRARGCMHPASLVLVGLLFVGGVLLVYAGRHLTFFYDEWSFVLTRRGGGLDSYLSPHNGHLVAVPVIIYKLLFAIVGLRHYTPYRVITVLLHLLSCGLLYALVRPRIGPWLALVPTALLLFLGSAWQDLLWPFQIGYLLSVSGGLGALLALEHVSRRRDLLAAVLLTVAVGSSGVGIAFIIACAVTLLAQRAPWRRFWIVVLPVVLFGIWYAGWSTGESTSSDAILSAPQYIASAAADATAGVAGLDVSWGPALLMGLVGGLILLWQRRSDRDVTPMVLAVLAGAFAFWGLTAVARAEVHEPAASRYVYVGAVFILLLVAEVAAGRSALGTWSLAAVALLALGAIISNVQMLRAAERGLRSDDVEARAALGAVEVAAPVVAPTFVPDRTILPAVAAGPYLAAVHDLGSPAFTLSELARQPESVRARADGVLIAAERLSLTPVAGALQGTRPLTLAAVSHAHVTNRGGCVRLDATPGPAATAASAELTISPASRLLIGTGSGSGARVFAGRLASTDTAQAIGELHGDRGAVSFPLDTAPALPWHVRLLFSGRLVVCGR